jgi:hypothetical protein
MGIILHMIAGTLAATRPEAAAVILAAAEARVIESEQSAQLVNAVVTAALGDERAGELRAYGAAMDWDQAIAYALSQTTQALSDLQPETQT